MRPTTKDLTAMVREYCAEHGLDPAETSVTFNAAYEITGHIFSPLPGFPFRDCCCGMEGCDGGLELMGVDPSQVTEYRGVFPLGAVERE